MTTALVTTRPDEMASLPTSLTRAISFETSNTLASDGQYEGSTVVACHIEPGASEADVRAALKVVADWCRPCGGEFAAQQLGLLRTRTKMRADQDGKLLAAAYVDWLAPYPADVAKGACEQWARTEKFFPAWAELQVALDRMMAKRLMLRKALAAILEPKAGALYLGKPKPESREDRLRAIRDAHARVGNAHRSARAERDLAALEGREPEDWARNLPEEQPTAAPEHQPFVPKNDAKTERLRQMARAWREKKEAERMEAAE